MRLFLDDVRSPPEGWTLYTNPIHFLDFLEKNWSAVVQISLDHDLGYFDNHGLEIDGVYVMNRIEEMAQSRGFIPFSIQVHSGNPVGAQRMRWVAEAINRNLSF